MGSLFDDYPNVTFNHPPQKPLSMPIEAGERLAKMRARSGGKSQSAKKRERLWKEQRELCRYCDRRLETAHHGSLDHIKPRSKGGKKAGNLALVCPECNALKAWFYTYDEAKGFADKLMEFFSLLRSKGIVS